MDSKQNHQKIYAQMEMILRNKFGARIDAYLLPPPIFEIMQGKFIDIDIEAGQLAARFPVLESYRNPYGAMQGGMITAAVDNTLGPLSVLVAPINVTRSLEMKFNHPVLPAMGFITVTAKFLERQGVKLFFEAQVSSPDGRRLAKCSATHWIIDRQAHSPPMEPA